MGDSKQELRLKEMKDFVRRRKRTGRANPTEYWWVSETLATDCESALLDTSWDEHMMKWKSS